MSESAMVRVSKDAFLALEKELVRRIQLTGNRRLTLKEVASEIILQALNKTVEVSAE